LAHRADLVFLRVRNAGATSIDAGPIDPYDPDEADQQALSWQNWTDSHGTIFVDLRGLVFSASFSRRWLPEFQRHRLPGGYNRKATREDTVAVLYRFTGFQYSNLDQSIEEPRHAIVRTDASSLGRMAFQVAAGPALVSLRIPLARTKTHQPVPPPWKDLRRRSIDGWIAR